MNSMQCPKCGFQQQEGGMDCLKCGVVFHKIKLPPAERSQVASSVVQDFGKRVEAASEENDDSTSLFSSLHATTLQWCEGQSWEFRVPVIGYFVYLLIRLIDDPGYVSLLWYINFMIHEAGHVFFRPLGELMSLAGGSIMQCLFPTIFMVAFLFKKDLFAISFCLGWLSTNLFYVAWYIMSARYSDGLAINPFGNEGWHDWFHILNQLGLFWEGMKIGYAVNLIAVLTMIASLVSGCWFLWVIYQSGKRKGNGL